jgi:hypothetical protein
MGAVCCRAADESRIPSEAQQRVAEQVIHDAALRAHIRFLADDLLEGRGPGTRGDALTQKYIAAQFASLGFQPAAPGGGWFQAVPLTGVTTQAPPTVRFRHGANSVDLQRHQDYVLSSGTPSEQVEFADAELVFVGYGIIAPEYEWDDYKRTDLRGKVLLMMNNDPSTDPELFAGSRRLYYGRWDYKYQMAARQGAVGAIIIHTTPSAGYPFQVVQTSWTGESCELRDHTGPRTKLNGWFTEDAARRVVALSGHDLDQLRQSAERRDFQPVALGTQWSVPLKCSIRHLDTANVLGLLPGRDPQLSKEWVIYMAHHDHLGMAKERNQQDDAIHNGAIDNASGVAALLTIAQAYARLEPRPARSILFAAVGAEEQGLLGSAYLAQHPPVPAGFLAALLNIDGINFIGPTRDVNVIGQGKSSLDLIVERIARWQQRVATPDEFPDRGYYYRSDQFSLAKIGVPGVYLHSGVHVIGQPEGWGRRRLEEWTETKYHQPSDQYEESWDLRGGIADTQLLFHVGCEVANQSELPRWNAGDEFEAARASALKARQSERVQ